MLSIFETTPPPSRSRIPFSPNHSPISFPTKVHDGIAFFSYAPLVTSSHSSPRRICSTLKQSFCPSLFWSRSRKRFLFVDFFKDFRPLKVSFHAISYGAAVQDSLKKREMSVGVILN